MTASLSLLPDIHFIGDPHLGKKFEAGVPIHRKGEREAAQMAQFRAELDTDAKIIIMVGDLFDHPYVGYNVVQETAQAILSAAERNDGTLYFFMAGNHDLPRNINSVGAFHDLRDRIIDRFDNLKIIFKPTVYNRIAFFPWEWDRRADEQVKDVEKEKVELVVGHWDLTKFNGKDDHLVPTDRLKEAFGSAPIVSGHYHIAGMYGEVRCTGSMQPYSHGEDPDETMYVTLTREQALERTNLKNMNVRLLLQHGEDVPEIDCLSLIWSRTKRITGQIEIVDLDKFDFGAMFAKKLATLDPRVQTFINEKIPSYEERTAEE